MAKTSSHTSRLHKFKEMLVKAFILTSYLGAWFCALVFLSNSILEIDDIPYIGFGVAIVKAAVSAKFMIMGLELFPLPINKGSSLIFGVLRRSVVYVLVVVALSYLFSGIEGYFHHKGFMDSLHEFAGGSFRRLLALSITYWLIIVPYLAFTAFEELIGEEQMRKYLLGFRKR